MSRVEGEIGIEDIAAIERSLPDVGAYVASVGMDKPLSAYSKDEVLGLIRASVAAYQGHMQALTLEELTGAGEVPW